MSATARSSSRSPWKACCANGTTLAGWLREEATDLKNTDTIEQAARAWDDNARQATTGCCPAPGSPTPKTLAAKPGFRDRLNAAREYLLASRQREDRRTEAAVRDAQEREAARKPWRPPRSAPNSRPSSTPGIAQADAGPAGRAGPSGGRRGGGGVRLRVGAQGAT